METTDRIYTSFLEAQYRDGMALAAASDLLDLVAIGQGLPNRYVATLRCNGLAKGPGGDVIVEDHHEISIRFPSDYLRRVNPVEVLHWLSPHTFHPNVKCPVICVGRLSPGTQLVDLLYQVFDLVTWKKLTAREDDALNPEACVWARNHPDRFPVDGRPLKRRRARSETPAAR
jgi:hypothetical protein